MEGLLLVILAFALYFLPYLTALQNKKRDSKAIGVLNLFLGWTIIGWVIALVWATTKDPQTP